jgi:carboxyl-terminal processing protease
MKADNLLLPLLFCALAGCGDKGGSSTPQSSAFEGIWTSETYGTTYEINSARVSVYQHDSEYCIRLDSVSGVSSTELEALFVLDDSGQSITDPGDNGVLSFHAPAIRYVKSDYLPAPCENPVATIDDPGYQRDPMLDLAIFARTFADYYLSFDLKQADWALIVEQAAARVSEDSSDENILDALYEMITPLADAHVHISSEELGTASVNGKAVLIERLIAEYANLNGLSLPLPANHLEGVGSYIESQLELYIDITLSYAADEADLRSGANGQLIWYQVDDIAYLQINAMMGFSADTDDNAAELAALEEALDHCLEDIQDSAGLIIDVRTNNGGQDFLSMAIASRFVSTEQLAFSKQARQGNDKAELQYAYIQPRGDFQYLKPVVLLTSTSTVSAAEVFTLIMRSLPQVTVVGEATQGALSNTLERKLPNGFSFSLSNEFYYSTEGEWFEGSGIPVDVEVPFFTQEQREAESDAGLEMAYAILTGN